MRLLGVYLGPEHGMVILVPTYDPRGIGLKWWVERDEDGTEGFLGNVLKRIHPVCAQVMFSIHVSRM